MENYLSCFRLHFIVFVSVTNSNNGTSKSLNSVIYKWKDDQFKRFQEIRTETEDAMASTTFSISNATFIVFANPHSSSQGYSVQSSVYKWSVDKFVKLTEGGMLSPLTSKVTHS